MKSYSVSPILAWVHPSGLTCFSFHIFLPSGDHSTSLIFSNFPYKTVYQIMIHRLPHLSVFDPEVLGKVGSAFLLFHLTFLFH